MASSVGVLSANHSRRGSVRRRRKPRGLLVGAVALCAGIAAVAWVIGALATVQTVGPSLPTHKGSRIEASLGLGKAERQPVQRNIRISKFSRLSPPSADEIRQRMLTADAIVSSHRKMASLAVASTARIAEEKARTFALATARAEKAVAAEKLASGQEVLVTAMVEDVDLQDGSLAKPFGLVMADPSADDLPGTIPLPEARPQARSKLIVEETIAKKTPTVAKELAYARPDRSLFDGLFGSKKDGWPGAGTRVAIYDIAAGKVYMPDGQQLEAHSGIDEMRDNPKFVHRKMRGSTPPGTFKLTMREKRFHGVEALRMTPVNGVHPHGRDGLLTHSYLLGRNGNSHGCVAFKDYQPFLKAFKRGKIDTMIVVPSLPKSKNQIASLISRAT